MISLCTHNKYLTASRWESTSCWHEGGDNTHRPKSIGLESVQQVGFVTKRRLDVTEACYKRKKKSRWAAFLTRGIEQNKSRTAARHLLRDDFFENQDTKEKVDDIVTILTQK